MDIFRINPLTWKPEKIIEGFSSMIWTERYLGNGSFELKTPMIAETMRLLPRDSIITLRDSSESMFVKTATITKNDDDIPELVLTGKTFETFLEHRVMKATYYGEKWSMMQNYFANEAAEVLIWNALANNTAKDVIRVKPSTADYQNYESLVPNLIVGDNVVVNPADVRIPWVLDVGNYYDTVYNFLARSKLGIRSIRPNVLPVGETRKLVRISPSGTVNVDTEYNQNIDEMMIQVYNGRNRTMDQTALPAVVFSYDAGDIDDPSYLFSTEKYKNFIVGYFPDNSGNSAATYYPPPDEPTNFFYTGLDRREDVVDLGDPKNEDLPLDQRFSARAQIISEAYQDRQRIALFDGTVAPTAKAKFGKDYFLGDQITLFAEYGFRRNMVVTEYIRNATATSETAYPTLSTPEKIEALVDPEDEEG